MSATFIDFSNGTIYYPRQINNFELIALLNALKSNVPIKRVECHGFESPSLAGLIALFEILFINKSLIDSVISPHIIEHGLFSFFPENLTQITAEELSSLRLFVNRFRIKNLNIKNCTFNENTLSVLCNLLTNTKSLTSVDFSLEDRSRSRHSVNPVNRDPYLVSDSHPSVQSVSYSHGIIHYQRKVENSNLIELLNALKSNVPIKRFECRGFESPRLEGIVALFEILSINKSLVDVNLFHHLIDLSLGSIHYQGYVEYISLISILNALKSNVPIKRVECRGFKSPSLVGLIVLYEILSFNKSLIDLDISSHIIDVEKGVFCYSPNNFTELTSEEVQSLQSFLDRFNIKELTLKHCTFTEDTITVLCNLLKNITSLTSVDFSHEETSHTLRSNFFSQYETSARIEPIFGCELTLLSDLVPIKKSIVSHKLISSSHSNSDLRRFCLNKHQIGFNDLLTMFKKLITTKLSTTVKISSHVINFSQGSILYQGVIENHDLLTIVNALNSSIPIKRVECRRFKRPTLEGLITLFEILSINQSLLDLDISPHLIDVEKECFVFHQKVSLEFLL
ncbi:hypothetical protein GEMRC1_000146 [Eukaryota sp. GEM-RC1]